MKTKSILGGKCEIIGPDSETVNAVADAINGGLYRGKADNVFTTENDGSLVVNGVVVVSPSKELTREQLRLMAAAPELLAHCQRFLSLLDGHNGEITQTFEAIQELRATIAKAKGES